MLEDHEALEIVRRALICLTPREEQIIRLRFGISDSLDDTETDFTLTKEESADLQRRSTNAKAS
jgi:DNA-directed RNA polymerase sigma subunit (sigma70/sigma32)